MARARPRSDEVPTLSTVADVMRELYHYGLDNFEDVSIPGNYASPDQLREAIRQYESFVQACRSRLDAVLPDIDKRYDNSRPQSVSDVLEAVTDTGYAISYALAKLKGPAPVLSSEERRNDKSGVTSHAVVLVHGIRDRGFWQNHLSTELRHAGFDVFPTSYGLWSALRFWMPIPILREQARHQVERQIRSILQNTGHEAVSVVAHSFGTHVVAHLLVEAIGIKWHRIIFCGSVVRRDFAFEQIGGAFSGPILNEVGTRDPWPALAESSTWGYGAAGSYGFNHPLVRDRWHQCAGHGYYLTERFCREFWIPFLRDGVLVDGERAIAPPLWVRFFSRIQLKWIVIGLAAALVLWLTLHFIIGG